MEENINESAFLRSFDCGPISGREAYINDSQTIRNREETRFKQKYNPDIGSIFVTSGLRGSSYLRDRITEDMLKAREEEIPTLSIRQYAEEQILKRADRSDEFRKHARISYPSSGFEKDLANKLLKISGKDFLTSESVDKIEARYVESPDESEFNKNFEIWCTEIKPTFCRAKFIPRIENRKYFTGDIVKVVIDEIEELNEVESINLFGFIGEIRPYVSAAPNGILYSVDFQGKGILILEEKLELVERKVVQHKEEYLLNHDEYDLLQNENPPVELIQKFTNKGDN